MVEVEEFHEPVFRAGHVVINNASYSRICLECGESIGAKSVHQISNNKCTEVKVHVHKWYKNTGNCYYPGCMKNVSLKYIKNMNADQRSVYLVTKEDIEKLSTGG